MHQSELGNHERLCVRTCKIRLLENDVAIIHLAHYCASFESCHIYLQKHCTSLYSTSRTNLRRALNRQRKPTGGGQGGSSLITTPTKCGVASKHSPTAKAKATHPPKQPQTHWEAKHLLPTWFKTTPPPWFKYLKGHLNQGMDQCSVYYL